MSELGATKGLHLHEGHDLMKRVWRRLNYGARRLVIMSCAFWPLVFITLWITH